MVLVKGSFQRWGVHLKFLDVARRAVPPENCDFIHNPICNDRDFPSGFGKDSSETLFLAFFSFHIFWLELHRSCESHFSGVRILPLLGNVEFFAFLLRKMDEVGDRCNAVSVDSCMARQRSFCSDFLKEKVFEESSGVLWSVDAGNRCPRLMFPLHRPRIDAPRLVKYVSSPNVFRDTMVRILYNNNLGEKTGRNPYFPRC